MSGPRCCQLIITPAPGGELVDTYFAARDPDGAAQEITGLSHGDHRTQFGFRNLAGDRPVSLVIVLAPRKTAADPGDVSEAVLAGQRHRT